MRENSQHLLTSDSGEPLEKIIYAGACFEVFEKSFYWNARPFEDPSAAHAVGHPLHSRTFIPIKHILA